MTKILTRLSAINFIGLVLASVLGSLTGISFLYPEWSYTSSMLHVSVSLLFVFVTLGIHCLIFIYFLGTGRWVKEVTLAYGMPDEPWHKRTRELKRATFPPALFSMLIGIAAAAAGAGAHQELQAWPWYVHMTLGLLTLLINLWAFRIELRNVAENAGIIDAVKHETDRIRAVHGLPTSEEALANAEESQ